MTPTTKLLDRTAREIVEELLRASAQNGADPWVTIVRRKLRALKRNLERRKK